MRAGCASKGCWICVFGSLSPLPSTMSTTALPSSTPSLAAFFGLDPTALLSREDAAMRKAHLYSKNAVKDRKPIHSPWIPKNLLTNLALESATSLLTVLKEVTDENPARFAVDASARPQAAVDLLNFSALWRHVLRNSYKPLIKDVTIEQSQRILELVASKTLLKNEQEMQIRITRGEGASSCRGSNNRRCLILIELLFAFPFPFLLFVPLSLLQTRGTRPATSRQRAPPCFPPARPSQSVCRRASTRPATSCCRSASTPPSSKT